MAEWATADIHQTCPTAESLVISFTQRCYKYKQEKVVTWELKPARKALQDALPKDKPTSPNEISTPKPIHDHIHQEQKKFLPWLRQFNLEHQGRLNPGEKSNIALKRVPGPFDREEMTSFSPGHILWPIYWYSGGKRSAERGRSASRAILTGFLQEVLGPDAPFGAMGAILRRTNNQCTEGGSPCSHMVDYIQDLPEASISRSEQSVLVDRILLAVQEVMKSGCATLNANFRKTIHTIAAAIDDEIMEREFAEKEEAKELLVKPGKRVRVCETAKKRLCHDLLIEVGAPREGRTLAKSLHGVSGKLVSHWEHIDAASTLLACRRLFEPGNTKTGNVHIVAEDGTSLGKPGRDIYVYPFKAGSVRGSLLPQV